MPPCANSMYWYAQPNTEILINSQNLVTCCNCLGQPVVAALPRVAKQATSKSLQMLEKLWIESYPQATERNLPHPFVDLFRHLLRVTEQHQRVVAPEQGIVDADVTTRHAAFDEHHSLGFPHFQHQHGHAMDGRSLFILGGRVGRRRRL